MRLAARRTTRYIFDDDRHVCVRDHDDRHQPSQASPGAGEIAMRVSKGQAAQNRRRILSAAARLFRENGIASSGIDTIARRAGLTHGAFYSQFDSKERVTAEAIRLALERSRKWLEATARGKKKRRAFADVVDAYLAPAHRDSPGNGCVIAALGADIARQPKSIRDAFTRGLKDWLALLAGLDGEGDTTNREANAIVVLSSMAGALILARAVAEQAFSRRILGTVARLKSGPKRRVEA
jgi:TetR/AcrR family transcriptional repressor of nem operon